MTIINWWWFPAFLFILSLSIAIYFEYSCRTAYTFTREFIKFLSIILGIIVAVAFTLGHFIK